MQNNPDGSVIRGATNIAPRPYASIGEPADSQEDNDDQD